MSLGTRMEFKKTSYLAKLRVQVQEPALLPNKILTASFVPREWNDGPAALLWAFVTHRESRIRPSFLVLTRFRSLARSFRDARLIFFQTGGGWAGFLLGGGKEWRNINKPYRYNNYIRKPHVILGWGKGAHPLHSLPTSAPGGGCVREHLCENHSDIFSKKLKKFFWSFFPP